MRPAPPSSRIVMLASRLRHFLFQPGRGPTQPGAGGPTGRGGALRYYLENAARMILNYLPKFAGTLTSAKVESSRPPAPYTLAQPGQSPSCARVPARARTSPRRPQRARPPTAPDSPGGAQPPPRRPGWSESLQTPGEDPDLGFQAPPESSAWRLAGALFPATR